MHFEYKAFNSIFSSLLKSFNKTIMKKHNLIKHFSSQLNYVSMLKIDIIGWNLFKTNLILVDDHKKFEFEANFILFI